MIITNPLIIYNYNMPPISSTLMRSFRYRTDTFTVLNPWEADSLTAVNNLKNNNMDLDKSLLKKRHLNREERQMFHKPNPDWVQTTAGEVCKSACTLVVDDLVDNS